MDKNDGFPITLKVGDVIIKIEYIGTNYTSFEMYHHYAITVITKN